TAADAEDFLKHAFHRYILSVGSEDPLQAENIWVELSNSAAVMRFFHNQFYGMLKMPSGMQLRIPVAVTAQDYEFSRVNDAPIFKPRTTPFESQGPFYDPRTIDHDTKP